MDGQVKASRNSDRWENVRDVNTGKHSYGQSRSCSSVGLPSESGLWDRHFLPVTHRLEFSLLSVFTCHSVVVVLFYLPVLLQRREQDSLCAKMDDPVLLVSGKSLILHSVSCGKGSFLVPALTLRFLIQSVAQFSP